MSTDDKQLDQDEEEDPNRTLGGAFVEALIDMGLSRERCGLPSKGRQGRGSSLNDMGGQLRVV
jgi:hypothetical protein